MMRMRIKTLVVGPIEVNCHILWDEGTKEAIVVDPGGNPERIMAEVKKEGLIVKAVVNTHGHSDHIGANDAICEETGAKLMIHKEDAPMLRDPRANLSAYMGLDITSRPADEYLAEGDEVKFGRISLKVLHTPGHSAGGICLYGEGVLLSGDTLFYGSIGRTDFPGGSLIKLVRGIKSKLLPLPEDTIVLTGHGPGTTIGEEKVINPYLG